MSSGPDDPSGPPRISVVLPTFNRAPVLGVSARTVLDQSIRDLELIIVDDGSADETETVVAALGDRRVRYLPLSGNRGQAAARNAGIAAARADLVAFHDSDDEWLEGKLERHLAVFDELGPGVDVTYSDMLLEDGAGVRTLHVSPTLVPGRLVDPTTGFYEVYGLGIQSTVARRSCLVAAGGVAESLRCFEDLELFLRLSGRCRFHHIPEPLVLYRKGEGVSTDLERHLRARQVLLRRTRREWLRRHPLLFAREWLKVHKGLAGLAWRRQGRPEPDSTASRHPR